MSQELPTPGLQLSEQELRALLREGDPPFTRRELRTRERAEEAGLLVRVDGKLQIAENPPAPKAPSLEQVITGTVPAASGMTRRQLRELAARQAAEEAAQPEADEIVDTGGLEETVESVVAPPKRVSTREVAEKLSSGNGVAPPKPLEETARRPVVRPVGARTGEYTGEFDQIRQAMADINAAPDTPVVTPPPRRSIFEATIPEELTVDPTNEEWDMENTDAADVSTVIDMPAVTDDVLTDDLVAEGEVESEPEIEPEPQSDPVPVFPRVQAEPPAPESAVQPQFPDWHAISTPQQPEPVVAPVVEPAEESSETGTGLSKSSALLTALQWIVIIVVAVVLGLLVWYAINRGFGDGGPEASGIMSALYYLRR